MLRARRLGNTATWITAAGLLMVLGLCLTAGQASAVCFAPPCPDGTLKTPDFNGDGIVNLSDFGIFASAFNSVVGGAAWNPACDLNCDGKVNLADLGIFAGFYNKVC